MLNNNTHHANLAKTIEFLLLLLILCFSGSQARAYTTETRTVTDQLGRAVKVPIDPRRVVALAPSITEIIFDLGEERRLKGVTQFSDYPAGASLLPKVGSYIHLDIERIVALNPDLCIAIKDGNPRHVVYSLEKLSIPVYVVDPRNLDAVRNTVVEIGSLLNARDKALKLARSMKKKVEEIKGVVSHAGSRPRVFFQIGISPIVSVGTNTFINELITIAGGINVTAGPERYPRYNIEQVLKLKPDIIVITSMARGGERLFEMAKRNWEKWPQIPACRNHRIYLVDSNLFDRPTPRLVKGLEILLKIIHPELVGDLK